MYRYLYLAIVTVFLISFEVPVQGATQDVLNAAQEGLHVFLSHIPTNAKEDFGFTGNDNLKHVVLGAPYNLYTIAPEALAQYKDRSPVTSILSNTKLWYFPVLLNNKARTILVVDQLDGEWRAVSLGHTYLANTLETITQRWPSSKGFNPMLINIFQANQYLLAVPEINVNALIIISGPVVKTHSRVTSTEEMVFEDSFQVIQRLIPIVTDNLNTN